PFLLCGYAPRRKERAVYSVRHAGGRRAGCARRGGGEWRRVTLSFVLRRYAESAAHPSRVLYARRAHGNPGLERHSRISRRPGVSGISQEALAGRASLLAGDAV